MAQIPANKKSNLEYIQDLRLFDDSFMCKVFEKTECVELLLQIALNNEELTVTDFKIQHQLTSLDRRTIKLDIYAVDAAGKLYDVEVQRSDKGASAKRARFHSAQMDSDYLKKSQDFEELPESYVIFITENDVFKRNRQVYRIKRVFEDNGEDFGDDTHIIYINGSVQDETGIGRLMHDFSCTKADDMYYSVFADRVRYLKEDEEGVKSMCRLIDALREEVGDARFAEGWAGGKEEGRAEEREESIRHAVRMMKDFNASADQIAQKISIAYDLPMDVTLQKVEKYWANA